METTMQCDKIIVFSNTATSHVTHHAESTAGLRGLEINELPFDCTQLDDDLEALKIEL